MLKNKKIKHLVWFSLAFFSIFTLLFLFVMQILLLNNYFEIYKTNQINTVYEVLNKSDEIKVNNLENLSLKYDVCISVLKKNGEKIYSSSYNRGCLIFDNLNSSSFIRIINNETHNKPMILSNDKFRNKTIVRLLEFDKETYIFLNASIEPLDTSIQLLKSQFKYISVIILIVSLVLSYYISNLLSEPIIKMSSSAKELAKGNFKVSFGTNSKISEIIELSNILETAKDELSRTDELRRDLMANVGHDLKTPLTMIKAYSEMIRDFDNMSEEKKKENLEIIIDEADRLTLLVNDILDLSKLQSNMYELKYEEFDVTELINSIIKKFDILIENENYNIIFDVKDKMIVCADKKRIEQVIYNLLSNAVNYTGDDKKIYINLIKDKKKTRVEIKDTGKGIEKEKIKYIWDKYYHNHKKHKRNAIGTGLGLSIVKNILETHGYEYGVISEVNKGTTLFFEISSKKIKK